MKKILFLLFTIAISANAVDSTINKLSITDEIRFKGDASYRALIQKNRSDGRDEFQIYASGDAVGLNSRGSGIHLYGNTDSKHSGNIAFMTGDFNKGTARLIISERGHISIGTDLWDYVDENKDTKLFNVVKNGITVFSIDEYGNVFIPEVVELKSRVVKIEAWAKQIGYK